jgi:hypothetical protein
VNTFLPPDASGVSGSTPPLDLPPAFRDRSTGLTIFGIIQIILGGFAALLIPLALLGAVMARKSGAGMPAGNYVMSIATYGLAAIVFCVLGIGSIKARRWAWAITLVTSWGWLILGAISTVALTAVLPRTVNGIFRKAAASTPNAQPLPAGVLAVILTLIIALCAFFMVVVPIVFVVFYRRKDVEQTFRRRDPLERWTDHCPLPVLAVSLLFAFGSVYYLLMSFTIPLFPFFGRYLIGLAGGICLLLFSCLDAFLAYALYRLRVTGWWIAVGALVVRFASSAVTFERGNLMQAYAKMGWSQAQLEMMSNSPGVRPAVLLGISLIFIVPFLGYMIWIKRYFTSSNISVGSPPVGVLP